MRTPFIPFKKQLLLWGIVVYAILISCHTNKSVLTIQTKDKDTLAIKQQLAHIKNVTTTLFESHQYTDTTQHAITYRLLRPTDTLHKKYPLVLVFHGSGAIGTDNTSQLGVLAKLWATPEVRNQYPAYVVVPQFSTRSSNYTLDNTRKVLTSKPESNIFTVLSLIDSLQNNLPIDKERIYVMGFSMGASTTINALCAKPHLFAAGVAFAGIPQFDKIDSLHDMPIWIIHGLADTENTIHSDIQFFKELHPYSHIQFWQLQNISHNDIFATQVILNNQIPKWLFTHKRKR